MAMSEKHRHAMYEFFLPGLGEEVTQAMLSHFPARDVEAPVTKEFLKSETTLVRMELREEIAGLRHELLDKLRTEFRAEMGGLRAELQGDMRRQFFWLMSTILTTLGIMVGLMVTILITMP